MSCRIAARPFVLALAVSGLLWPAAPGFADPPAAIAPANSKARSSFEAFARTWMGKLRAAEKHNRAKSGSTYKGPGSDFDIELRPTGYAAAPFVGILRYKERTYRCAGGDCTVAAVTPVTEIFRFQGGRWIY